MNIYLVIEDQWPDAQLIMICECENEDQAKLAYFRLWFPVESRDAAVIFLAIGTREQPAILWKNFEATRDLQESKIKNIENGTEQQETQQSSEDNLTDEEREILSTGW